MMPFLLAEFANLEKPPPLYVCCVGSHEQKELHRPAGYPAHQLILTRSGKGTFYMDDGRELKLSAGMILLLPANEGHFYRPDDSYEVWDLGFVAFHGAAANGLLDHMGDLVLKPLLPASFELLWHQLEDLWHLISLNGENAYWEASRRMYDILLTILEGQSPVRKSTKKVYPSDQPNPGLQAAVKLIHDHYDERLLLANVARAAGYSIQHFHRLFVADYGATPQQYILKLRMRRSLQLFEENPGITVERVAEKLGMDTSYFIRMFKRTYGVTPKRYLKEEK
jgi:AraC-like DNA-binding protein